MTIDYTKRLPSISDIAQYISTIPGLGFFQRAVSPRSFCQVRRYLTDTVFLHKNGSVGIVIKTDGLDDETISDAQAKKVSDRLMVAGKRWNGKYRIYRYCHIRRRSPLPRGERTQHESDILKEAQDVEMQLLESAGSLKSSETYLVILFEGMKASSRLHPKQLQRRLSRAATLLEAKAKAYCRELGDLIRPEILKEEDAFRYFYFPLNLRPSAWKPIPRDEDFDYHAANSQIRWEKDRLRIGRRDAYLFSMKEEPGHTSPNLFRKLQSVNADLIIWQEWNQRVNSEIRAAADEHRESLNAFERQSVSKQLLDKDRPADTLMENQTAKNMIKSLGQIGVQLEEKGLYFGRFSMGGMVYNVDPTKCAEVIQEIEQIFYDPEAQIIEEVDGAQAAFRAMNLSPKWNVRPVWMQNDHFADLDITAYSPYTGQWFDKSLYAESWAVFASRTGYPFSLTAFTNQVMGHLVLGKQRTGKSFYVNWMLLQLMKYSPLIFVFDVGESYNYTTRACGGEIAYIDGSGKVKVNPFADDLDLDFHTAWIWNALLLAKYDSESPVEDEEAIRFALRELYERQSAQNRTLSALALPGRMKDLLLDRWGIFDTPDDTLKIAEWQTFNFKFGESEDGIKEQFIALILHRVNNVIRDPRHRNRLKVAVFEELWHHLKNKKLAELVLGTLKDGPKWFCGSILITQSAGDITSPLIRELINTIHCFENPEFDRSEFPKWGTKELDAIESLVPREVAVKTQDHCKVLRFDMPKENVFYWWFSTNPVEAFMRDDLVAKHGATKAFELLTTQHEELVQTYRSVDTSKKKAMRKTA